MKTHTSGRDTIRVNFLALTLNGPQIEAHSIAPFLVRAKWSYEPFVAGDNWEEPDTPEWFAFDGLYFYQETLFKTEEGIVVTVGPHVEITNLLTKAQLQIIEDALRESWEAETYEPMNDYEYGI